MPGRTAVRRSLAVLASAALLAAGAGPGATGAPAPAPRSASAVTDTVVAISIDALNPQALNKLGRSGTPHLHALLDEGASTLNARTEHELTVTLPNHTGMVTGRRVHSGTGGHGVTWNDDRRRPRTVQAAADEPVESVFTVVDDAGLSAGFFASKTKFSLWDRSWPLATDAQTIIEDNQRLVRAFKRDLRGATRAFRFLHLSEPDSVGHDGGFMGRAYLRAVRRADRRVGSVLELLRTDPRYAGRTTVVLTSDHGGRGASHTDPTKAWNYRVPFVVWGTGVDAGSDLYALNPDYADPGRARASYDGVQPVRNGVVANLALDLLGLPAVPGSEHDADQDLDVSAD
jgi:Type I phosphodiesterase / nucleotide pyrophosphatase